MPGLVSWWPAEGNPVDTTGGNSGVLLNGATFAPGKFGQAFSFNGSGAHVRIADNANLHLTNGLTLALWVYPTASGAYLSFSHIKRVMQRQSTRTADFISPYALMEMNLWVPR